MKKTNEITGKYLFFTFLITYMIWWSIVIANIFGYLKYGTPPMMILYLIGGNAPPVVAAILLLKSKTMTAKGFLKETFKIKQKLMFYLIAILFAALYYSIPLLFGAATISAPLYSIFLMFPVMIIGGGLEEIGWRYILQSNLEKKIPFLLAVFITFVFWDIWHLPLFFIEGTNQFNWDFGVFTITTLGLSFALAALFRISKSLWMCIFLHSLINAIGESINTENSYLSAAIITFALIAVSLSIITVDNFMRNREKYTIRI